MTARITATPRAAEAARGLAAAHGPLVFHLQDLQLVARSPSARVRGRA